MMRFWISFLLILSFDKVIAQPSIDELLIDDNTFAQKYLEVEASFFDNKYNQAEILKHYVLFEDIHVIECVITTGSGADYYLITINPIGELMGKLEIGYGYDNPGDEPYFDFKDYYRLRNPEVYEIILTEYEPLPEDMHLVSNPDVYWLDRKKKETKSFFYYKVDSTGKIIEFTNSNKLAEGRSFPMVSQRILESYELDKYSSNQLQIMRNEIFAAHGYIFKTSAMKDYFSKQAWYKSQHKDVNHLLTDVEKVNIPRIVKRENELYNR